MSDLHITEKTDRKSHVRPSDVFVVIFCVCGMGASLYLFQQDLFTTFNSQNMVPAGTVTIKYNTVQRRLADRVAWDRLFDQSPVYNGDVIRIARSSGAVLDIEENNIELGENTLIRIQRNSGAAQIDFFSGGINISSTSESGVIFVSMGDRVIEASPGAVFSASSGDEGIILRVTEGSAQVTRDGRVEEISAGTIIAEDAQGNVVLEPMAAVSAPRPNARYLKQEGRPLNVPFSWSRINLRSSDLVRLEAAQDRNFSRDVRVVENLDSSAVIALDSGIWNWRLLFENKVLAAGRIEIAETSIPVLLNPQDGNHLRMRSSRPEIQFRWSEVPSAIYYHLQVSPSPDFTNLKLSVDVQGTGFITANLETGTWHWRVQPVYSAVFEGDRNTSQIASFRIDMSGELEAPALILPAPDGTVVLGDNRDITFAWSASREAENYTIQVFPEYNSNTPVINRTIRENYYVYSKDSTELTPGRYLWRVFYTASDGAASPVSQPRALITMEREVIQRLTFPPDRYSVEEARLGEIQFAWETNLETDKRFQISSRSDFSDMEIDVPVSNNNISGITIPGGDWYWRISAKSNINSPAVSTLGRRFSVIVPRSAVAAETPQEPVQPVLQAVETLASAVVPPVAPAAAVLAPVPPPPVTAPVRPPEPPPPLRLTLIYPAQGTIIPGLTALRQPTVFQWDTAEAITSSRFVISRQINPAANPEIVINNPGRRVTVNTLSEGLWYWSVEGRTADGRPVTPVSNRQIRVLSIPLLPAPENLRPEDGFHISAERLRWQRNISFSWSEVEGANRYVISIFRGSSSGRPVFQSEPLAERTFTFDNFDLIENNTTYLWEVEAFSYSHDGVLEQRGNAGRNNFIIDVRRPGQIQARDMGIMYGTQ